MEIKIYKITNINNNKVYIGQTTRSLKTRMYDHIAKANSGMQRKLQKAIVEFGKEKFKIEQICICSDAKTADELELYYIKKYNSIENGYNTRNLAAGSFNRGSQNGMYGKKGNKSPSARPIITVKYDDNIAEWESMSLFCEANPECDIRNVQAAAVGKRNLCCNFVIFYKENYSEDKLIEIRKKSKSKRITWLDENKELIKHFENLEEAKKETKISKATITNRIKNGIKNKDKSYFVYDFKIFK